MKDPETQAALDRINQANQRTVAWMWCAASTFLTAEQIFEHWSRWTALGKMWAGLLSLFLVLFPCQLIILTKKKKPIPLSSAMLMGYLLLFAAVFTFGPASHIR